MAVAKEQIRQIISENKSDNRKKCKKFLAI